jgi:UDP-glucose 4-epimerase
VRALVTGGAGFIGSHLVDRLLSQGHSVTVYDNLSSGSKGFILKHFGNPLFDFVEADLLEIEDVKGAVRGSDIVFHMASNPDISKGMVQTDLDLKQGVLTLYNVLDSMRLADVKRIFFPSGSGVYGDIGITCTESAGPLLPISLYGASKLACEGMISAFCNMFDMQAWIARPANIVGARQTHGVTLDFIRKLRKTSNELVILGDGSQSKSYIHVSDCINAIILMVNRSSDRVNVFNVASSDFLDVTSISRLVAERMGLENVRFVYTGGDRGWKGDVPKVRMDVSKIRALGWQCSMTSAEAVSRAVSELLAEMAGQESRRT